MGKTGGIDGRVSGVRKRRVNITDSFSIIVYSGITLSEMFISSMVRSMPCIGKGPSYDSKPIDPSSIPLRALSTQLIQLFIFPVGVADKSVAGKTKVM